MKTKRVLKALTPIIMAACLIMSGCVKSYYNLRVREYNKANKNAAKGAIVFLGDSLTELCSLEYYYPSEFTLYNRGISGDTTDGVLKRLSDNVLSIEPAQIVLLIGINDLSRGKSAGYVLQNITAIIEAITAGLPGCRLIVQSLYPVYDTALENYTRNTAKILEINSKLEQAANGYGYIFVNAFDSLKTVSNELDKKFSLDGLHLNSEGYNAVAPLITAELVKHADG